MRNGEKKRRGFTPFPPEERRKEKGNLHFISSQGKVRSDRSPAPIPKGRNFGALQTRGRKKRTGGIFPKSVSKKLSNLIVTQNIEERYWGGREYRGDAVRVGGKKSPPFQPGKALPFSLCMTRRDQQKKKKGPSYYVAL